MEVGIVIRIEKRKIAKSRKLRFILGNGISVNTLVIQSEAKNLGNTMAGVNVDVHEILPPFGRLNDK